MKKVNYIEFWKKNLFYFLCAFFIGISFILKGNVLDHPLIDNLGSSNFVSYGPNVIFILLIATFIHNNVHISNFLIVRSKIKKFLYFQYSSTFLMLFIYTFSQYLLAFVLATISGFNISKIDIVFIITNTISLAIIVLILNLMNYGVNRLLLIILSIGISLMYHYAFLMSFLNELYTQY